MTNSNVGGDAGLSTYNDFLVIDVLVVSISYYFFAINMSCIFSELIGPREAFYARSPDLGRWDTDLCAKKKKYSTGERST